MKEPFPMKRIPSIVIGSALAAQLVAAPPAPAADAENRSLVERGRYIVRTAGCNDCHTPGYAVADGNVSEKLWLTGDALGWSGPWGTTYATNLRLYMARHTEASWLQTARSFKPRPPMPWFNVHAMNDRDLRALYRYVRHLGPAGEPAPAWVPPGETPRGPVVRFPD
jgi:mono/diheme cytochrome c family protein